LSANKRKILENAQKYLQRGQLDKALKEFQAALQADPRDTGTRLKIGDIHLKQGNKDEAVVAYLKVADQFMKDGFDARAVALYKQILKIDAARADVHIPLAELYTRLGLTSDAMASLQTAADAYHREGRKRDALELLRKMARLDPTNITSRLKIAELLQQAGMKDEALAELDELARDAERIADVEEMKRVYERLLELDGSRYEAHVGLGRIALTHTDFGTAERHARQALELRPDASDGLELVADVLRESGREDELEPIYRRLADVYRERGDEDRARAIVQRYVSSGGLELGAEETAFGGAGDLGGGSPFGAPGEAGLSADGPSFDDELVLDEEPEPEPVVAVAPPAPAPVPASAAAAPVGGGDPDQLVAEANVYLRYGKVEKAIASLESALAAEPSHRSALTKLAEVMEQRGELDRASGLRERAGGTAPSLTRAAAAAPAAPASADDDDLGDFAFETAPASEEEEAAPEQSGPLEIDVDVELESTAPPAAAPRAVETSADVDDLDVDLDLDLDPEEAEADAGASDALDLDEPGAPATPAGATSGGSSTSTAVQIVEELEEAEFYFHQSLFEEAEGVYRRVLTLAPNHPQAMLRLGEIEAARGGDGASTNPNVAAPAAPIPAGEATVAFPEPDPSVAGDEGSFDLAGELGLDDETGSPNAAPIAAPGEDSSTQPSVTAQGLEPEGAFALDLEDTSSVRPASASPAPSRGMRGLATTRPVALDVSESEAPEAASADEGSVEDALAAAMAVEEPVESQPVAVAVEEEPEPVVELEATPALEVAAAETPEPAADEAPAANDDFDLAAELSDAFADANRPADEPGTTDERFDEGFHAVFDEFKRGVKRVVGEGDHETHFDLGIAYREMGLLEDAVGEFAQAVASPTRRLAALHMMGLCALDLKRPADAVAHLEQALSLPDLPGDQTCALHCDLARGFVDLGDVTRARDAIERATAIDPAFPELARRRKELEALEAGTLLAEAEAEAEPVESFESFDDLIAEARSDAPATASAAERDDVAPAEAAEDVADSEPATAARAATTGAATPAPPAPAAPTPGRKRKISFL